MTLVRLSPAPLFGEVLPVAPDDASCTTGRTPPEPDWLDQYDELVATELAAQLDAPEWGAQP